LILPPAKEVDDARSFSKKPKLRRVDAGKIETYSGIL
jgi:hypothetical protein